MAKCALIATASVQSEADVAAYNEWYNSTHIPEVSAALGCVTNVTRYAIVDHVTGEESKVRFSAVYELDTDDLHGTAAKFFAALPGLNRSEHMDREIDPPVMQWLRAFPHN